jgi:hypothetical protein
MVLAGHCNSFHPRRIGALPAAVFLPLPRIAHSLPPTVWLSAAQVAVPSMLNPSSKTPPTRPTGRWGGRPQRPVGFVSFSSGIAGAMHLGNVGNEAYEHIVSVCTWDKPASLRPLSGLSVCQNALLTRDSQSHSYHRRSCTFYRCALSSYTGMSHGQNTRAVFHSLFFRRY